MAKSLQTVVLKQMYGQSLTKAEQKMLDEAYASIFKKPTKKIGKKK